MTEETKNVSASGHTFLILLKKLIGLFNRCYFIMGLKDSSTVYQYLTIMRNLF